MNRRSFFAFLGAAPLAGLEGLRPQRPITFARIWDMIRHFERRPEAGGNFSKGEMVWIDENGNLTNIPSQSPATGLVRYEDIIGRPGT